MNTPARLILLASLVVAVASWAAAADAELRVMTFNIRFGTAVDGVNDWANRRDLCADRIKSFDPDLLGVQEALLFQNTFLQSKLPGYATIGVGRDDGKGKGEFSTIFYRKSRFTPISSGTFWLSATPDTPGSKGWDAAKPRIATWARLRDLNQNGRELLWLNTHLDHHGEKSRVEAVRLIRHFLEAQGHDLPVVVTGDFNSIPDGPAYVELLRTQNGSVPLTDAYRADSTRSAAERDAGTSHGYRIFDQSKNNDQSSDAKEANRRPQRIDWILNSPDFTVRSVVIDRFHQGPLFPSDHFPVLATLAWKRHA